MKSIPSSSSNRTLLVARSTGHGTAQHFMHRNFSTPASPLNTTSNDASKLARLYGAKLSLPELRATFNTHHNNPFNINVVITCQIKLCTTWLDAQELFIAFSHHFNHINIATLVCHLPKVVSPSALEKSDISEFEIFSLEVNEVAEQLLHHCRPRELANIAYGFAKLGLYSKRLMQLIAGRCMHLSLSGFNDQELANLLWAFTTVQHPLPPALATEFCDELMVRLEPQRISFKPQELSSIAYCFVSMYPRPPASLMKQLADYARPRLKYTGGRGLANLLWSFAKMNYRLSTAWMDEFLPNAMKELKNMESQHLAQMSYALYIMHLVPHQSWMTAFLDHLKRSAGKLAAEPQDLCMVLLLLSRLHPRQHSVQLHSEHLAGNNAQCSLILHAQLLQSVLPAVSTASVEQMSKFGPKDLATALLCFAHIGYEPPAACMEAFLGQVCSTSCELNAQDLSNILWALARLHYKPSQQFFKMVARQTVNNIGCMNAQNMANTLWALAKLHACPSQQWLQLVLQELTARHEDLVLLPGHAASIAWALPRLVPQAKHPAFVQSSRQLLLQLEESCISLLPSCSQAELVQIRAGFAKLGYLPSNNWLTAFAKACQKDLPVDMAPLQVCCEPTWQSCPVADQQYTTAGAAAQGSQQLVCR